MIDFQKNCHAGDVVDNRVVFAPSLRSCSNDCVTSLLRAVFQIVRPHNLGDVLVAQEFPNAITCDDNKLVVGLELEAHDFRVSAHS